MKVFLAVFAVVALFHSCSAFEKERDRWTRIDGKDFNAAAVLTDKYKVARTMAKRMIHLLEGQYSPDPKLWTPVKDFLEQIDLIDLEVSAEPKNYEAELLTLIESSTTDNRFRTCIDDKKWPQPEEADDDIENLNEKSDMKDVRINRARRDSALLHVRANVALCILQSVIEGLGVMLSEPAKTKPQHLQSYENIVDTLIHNIVTPDDNEISPQKTIEDYRVDSEEIRRVFFEHNAKRNLKVTQLNSAQDDQGISLIKTCYNEAIEKALAAKLFPVYEPKDEQQDIAAAVNDLVKFTLDARNYAIFSACRVQYERSFDYTLSSPYTDDVREAWIKYLKGNELI